MEIKEMPNVSLTIEKQLEHYMKLEGHSPRYEVLWHTWHQNKRWIVQLLEGTAISFPTYSKHDESHAETVLHNIELILGEERIAKLSATDCFMLLHAVYIHDIGMTITAAERKEIITNDHFMKMVDYLEVEGDVGLRNAVRALKREDYSNDEQDSRESMRKLYEAKLEIYSALVNLISNYRRSEHGKKSGDRLYEWTLDKDKLGSGFSLSGMPQRIFLTIAECAKMHTEPDFDEILELAQEDDGYVSDYMHPRFISLMLQLGDLLDMDNDRFHPLAMSSLDEIPEMSLLHYKKHLSIRRLHIRPDSIEISADCDSQDALRLVRKECDMLIKILQQAGYAWPTICPAGFPGALPIVKEVNLKLRGQTIPKELVTMQFEISQKKAFQILEGANLYESRFAFLREFLQNALDASKIQYWRECLNVSGLYSSSGDLKSTMPQELETYVSTQIFPIEIEMEIYKRDASSNLWKLCREDVEELKSGKPTDDTWGVLVGIKDYGTGIDKEKLKQISRVGTSIDKERDLIRSMPEWLRPTAEFGVGLQSVFLITDTFKGYTHTRSEEGYEITFGSGSVAQFEGYINVKPLKTFHGKKETYGTWFEVFVPENKKMLHEQFPASWDGMDIFSEDYETLRPLRHAAELMSQMTLYLDSLVGNTSLFPINLTLRQPEGIQIPINIKRKNQIHYINTKTLKYDLKGRKPNNEKTVD